MKRFLTLLLAALLICALAMPMVSAEEKTQLTILWWGSQTRHDLTVAMIEKFEEKYPDIDLVMDYSDWSGYWTKLAAQVSGGQTPDIFQMDYAYLAQYATNNVLAPLDEYMASGALDVSNVSENINQNRPGSGRHLRHFHRHQRACNAVPPGRAERSGH